MLTGKVFLSLGFGVVRRREPGGTSAPMRRHRHPPVPPGRGKSPAIVTKHSRFGVRAPIHHGEVSTRESASALEELASEIQASAWDLALAAVDEGLIDDQIPSLQRLGRLGQLGDMPTFIVELAGKLVELQPEGLRRGSPLAAQARDHARQREAYGFAPREIVTEFLILRRVLWRFVSERAAELDAEDVLACERRLNDTIDQLVTECVVAYFDRATSELAHEARHDQLTGLLHHQAFVRDLELELERAARYGHGLALVFLDLDRFKELNDTFGHQEGDRALRRLAGLLMESLRSSDLAGRMGGDEFAAYLVEADEEAGARLLARLNDRVDELIAAGELPPACGFSAGVATFPEEATDADALFRLADRRLYEAKRSRAA
jgi:diguanylate cyclase (GGDEF)-like protein